MPFRVYSVIIIIISAAFAVTCFAQQSITQRSGKLVITADSIRLDSLVIVKGSFVLTDGKTLLKEGVDYTINCSRGLLYPAPVLHHKVLQYSFRIIPYPLTKKFSNKSAAVINPEFQIINNPFIYIPNAQSEVLFSREGLKMNGSLSRGLSFGNNQNVVLNANLNLQLAGRLQNDIDVLAAISDENNPIQPEGNTQQLQDFDKVFIRLSKNKTALTVGDFEMARPDNSYFMNYFKKSRGGQFYTALKSGKHATLQLGGEAAISRGRFARNVIQGIEGNQGPYRLSGANNELFIILISGTEAIYLDGQRLVRGEQNDYVIDYNSGEITFMPRRVITQYSRIVVEFQYSDRNFARSVVHTNAEYHHNRFRIRANYFTEQDDPDQPFLQNLTDSNKRILAAAGDNLSKALAPSESPTNVFAINKILYRKIDTLGFQGVFVYANSAGTDTQFFEVRFSFVGQGRGDYVQAESSANGRVFKWVSPTAGVRQGDYAPVVQLVSPKRLQMLSLGTDLMLLKNTTISVELARSEYDKNRYSEKDKSDDAGYGIKTGITHTMKLQQKENNYWFLKTEAGHEYVDKQFRFVERYRSVEFDRLWNRLLNNTQTTDTGYEEHIVSFRTSLNHQQKGNIYFQSGYYNRQGAFTGWQQTAGMQLHHKKSHLSVETEWLDTRNATSGAQLTNETRKHRLDYGRQIWRTIAGVRYETERSSFSRGTDTLLNGSFAFNQYTFYINNTDTGALTYKIEYSQREDFLPRSSEFKSSTLGKNLNGSVLLTQQNTNRLTANITYREFLIRDTGLIKLQPENTILMRLEYDYGFLKRVFTANTYYAVGKGNELRRDFQFLEVPPGQGIYVWRDFNRDGLQGLNEFVVASGIERNQANFIKIFLPTNSSIRVQTNQFNQTLNINPAVFWAGKRGLKRFLSRWYNQTAVKLDRKKISSDDLEFLNPFEFNFTDSVIVSNASLIRNALFYNRTDPVFGFDLNITESRNKTFQTNGFDSRQRREQGANLRWNFTSSWGITMSYLYGNRAYTSDFFTANNYSYVFNEAKPRIIYQLTSNIRATVLYSYFIGANKAELGNETGINEEIGMELRYNAARQGVLNAKFSYFNVQYVGDISSPLGYDMMQGLTAGENMVWNISFQQRLGNNLQINVNYDGRKSGNQDIINIGRMEARYVF
jgi:hypothetical protein